MSYSKFLNREFYVDERVLIPREKTEWTAKAACKAAARLLNDQNEISIMDMGTGCAAIIISAYLELINKFPKKVIKAEAVDVSTDALDVASINVKKYNLERNIHLYKSDLLSNVSKVPDVLIANLPYLPMSSFVKVHNNNHDEPAIAMFDINDGIGLAEQLLNQVSKLESKPKVVVIENDGINITKLKDKSRELFKDKYVVGNYFDMDGKERGIVLICQ